MPRSAAVLRDLDAPAGLHAAYTMTHRLPDDVRDPPTPCVRRSALYAGATAPSGGAKAVSGSTCRYADIMH